MSEWSLVFWLCLGVLIYVYAGYPVLVRMLAILWGRRPAAAPCEPTVTILIAAYNEADHIVATLRNKLTLDYPAEKLQIIVVSDGSDDGTDELVAGLASDRLRFLRQEPRAGKTAALNRGLACATGEVIVFSDANSLYAPDALRQLLAPLADACVGYVTGRMVYKAPDGSLTGEGCSAYMSYENKLREWETEIGSIVGVDGGIDAVKKELYRPMRPDQLPDLVLPLAVRQQGYRVVYMPGAHLYEDALTETKAEFRMRVRVSLRAWHAIKDMAVLLNPWRYGLFAWQLFSHKVLRYLAPFFQLGAFVANLILAEQTLFWTSMLALQVGFYLLAAGGYAWRNHRWLRFARFATYLCVLNAASLMAFVHFLQGRKQVVWQPRT